MQTLFPVCSDPHCFHTDTDSARSYSNANLDAGCQSIADPCGSGSRAPHNEVLVTLNVSISPVFHLFIVQTTDVSSKKPLENSQIDYKFVNLSFIH